MAIEKEKLIAMYRTMVRIRTFEERVKTEFAMGKIPAVVHLSSGQEAIATGACANLRPDDYITGTHRGHGQLIAKGGKTNRIMAELFGKKTGYSKGKGGTMHMADVEIGMLGGNGIVGAGIPIAAGAALSAKKRGTDQVTVCFLGDGAANTGRFHEGLNLASAWNLPMVYIIENNVFACTTRISDVCKLANLGDRACAYAIPGKTIDGNDVVAVYEAVGQAVAQARKGEGPTLIECKTCRWHGHYEGDPQTYRISEDVEECMKSDPIKRFKQKLIEMRVLTENDADKIAQEINEEIEKSVKFAEESPFPTPEETLEDVYA